MSRAASPTIQVTWLNMLRRASSKDISALRGPYSVVRVDAEAGQVIVKMAGQDRPNRLGDVRHTLFVNTMWFLGRGPPGQPADVVLSFIADLPVGKIESFGMINASNGHEVTKATRDHPDVALALHNVIQTHFGMDVAEANLVRLGHGIAQYPLVKTSHRCCIIWWRMVDPEGSVQVIDANSTNINMKTITDEWQTCGSIQMCHVDECPLNFGEAASQATSTIDTPDDTHSTDGGRLSTILEERSTELNSSDNDSALIEFTNLYFADADIEDIRPIFETLQLTEDDEDDNDTEWCFPVAPDTHTSNADMNPKAHFFVFLALMIRTMARPSALTNLATRVLTCWCFLR